MRRVALVALIAALLAGGGAFTVSSCLSLARDPNALAVGAAAPEPALLTSAGQPFALSALHPGGLKVLVFYRGAW